MIKLDSYYNTSPLASMSFGSTERSTGRRLHKSCESIANCDYFIRQKETFPDEMGEFLVYHARNADEVEMKIWGCSDLSSFVARKMSMLNTIGEDEFRKLFGRIELIDIDEDIVNRAKKGLIGASEDELEDLEHIIGVKTQDYMIPVNSKDFFLKGEPRMIPTAPWGEYRPIKPYKLSDSIMNDLDIHVGDIREDLKNLPQPREGVKRIFEFANGWYFMPPGDHVKLVSLLSEKMQASDIMLVGNCELRQGVGGLLERFGFCQFKNFPEAFVKVQDLGSVSRKVIKALMKCIYNGEF